MEKTLAVAINEANERAANGNWYPACNGSEVPFTTRNGFRLQYMWQPSTGRHAYYDCERDLILSDDEAAAAIGL